MTDEGCTLYAHSQENDMRNEKAEEMHKKTQEYYATKGTPPEVVARDTV